LIGSSTASPVSARPAPNRRIPASRVTRRGAHFVASVAAGPASVGAVPSGARQCPDATRSSAVRLRGKLDGAALAGHLAKVGECPAQQPRDVHLRDADLLSDLRLAEFAREAQLDDLTLAVGQASE
jgi:hypothetical protein